MDTNYYELFGVAMTATSEEIRKAYKKLARDNHPDKTGNDAEKTLLFKKITEAYETLSDPNKRATYNGKLPKKTVPRAKQVVKPRFASQAPNFDIWGNPLTADEKELWLLENLPIPPMAQIRALQQRIKLNKVVSKPKPKQEEQTFYNEPSDSVFTKNPVDGMHYHNPNMHKKKDD